MLVLLLLCLSGFVLFLILLVVSLLCLFVLVFFPPLVSLGDNICMGWFRDLLRRTISCYLQNRFRGLKLSRTY